MAGTIHLRLSEPFNFRKPDEWLKWHKRFEQFRIASRLSAEAETRQVSTLLYSMGEKAKDVLASIETLLWMERKSTKLSQPDSMNISRFTKMSSLRESGSTVEANRKENKWNSIVITSLYRLAETRKYGDL